MKDPTATLSPLADVTRSGRVESRHLGAVAVVAGDALQQAFGDVTQSVYTRSAIKPLQALPLLEREIDLRLGLSDRELAVICASHVGSDEHVAVVRGLLAKAGLDEDALRCGAHAPRDRAAARALVCAGQEPGRIHNNCSGKHAGFLLLARELGTPAECYLEPDSAVQVAVREAVAGMAGIPAGEVTVGLDGCGAPTLGMPLLALARAFGRLANPRDLPAARARACQRLAAAITAAPVMLAGEGRLPTTLVRSAPGKLLPKNGAEGVFAAGVVGDGEQPGFGVAMKVVDGADRAAGPVMIEVLRRLGVWEELPAVLADFARVPLRNTQGILVGHVQSALPEASVPARA